MKAHTYVCIQYIIKDFIMLGTPRESMYVLWYTTYVLKCGHCEMQLNE